MLAGGRHAFKPRLENIVDPFGAGCPRFGETSQRQEAGGGSLHLLI